MTLLPGGSMRRGNFDTRFMLRNSENPRAKILGA